MGKIDKKYHKLLNKILAKGYRYEDPNRKGTYRIEIPDYKFKWNFKDGFPAITTKKLYWKGVVGELLWFLRGDTNIKYLVDNNINIWNKDAYSYYLSKGYLDTDNLEEHIDNVKNAESWIGDLGRVYGAQWRGWNITDTTGLSKEESKYLKIDQISNLIKGLKENPMGTKHIVTAWNPAELNDMALPPCHWSFEILTEPLSPLERMDFLGGWREVHKKIVNTNKSIEEFLDEHNIPKYKFTLKWHQRSVDTFLGLPFNIASYALLAQIIGKMTNMIPKGIIGDLSNVHIYEPHLDAVKEQLSRDVDKYPDTDSATSNTGEVILHGDEPLNTKLDLLSIKDFQLPFYKSYSKIEAEMIAYKK